jgi:flagellar export protein FliJ
MKPFRFSLQPIRVLREQKEQKAQQTFADAMRVCDEAAFQLKAASEELVAAWNAMCHEMSAGVNASQVTRSRAWCNVLELRQKERAAALQHAQRAMETAVQQMRLATRDREAIDKYRAKRRQAYDHDVQRDEQKTLDELGTRRAASTRAFAGSQRLNHL